MPGYINQISPLMQTAITGDQIKAPVYRDIF